MDEKGISNNLDMQLDRVYRNTLLQVHDLESPDGFFRGNCANLTEEELDQLGFHTPQIQEIQLGREAGVDVSEYAKDFYNWKQMREIRRGLEQRVDVRLYKNPLFSSGQMRQIRMGLNDGLDVSVYADLMYSVTDMKSIRESLLSEVYTDNDKGYGKKTVDEATGIIMHISDDYLTAYVTLPRKKEEITMADVMVTGEEREDVKANCYKLGAMEIINKPFTPHVVYERVTEFINLFENVGMLEGQLKKREDELELQKRKMEEFNSALIEAISNIVEFRDTESGVHIKRVKFFTRIIAEHYQKLFPDENLTDMGIDNIEAASVVHDIGKVTIPDAILLKPGKLIGDEIQVMRSHTTKGCEIIQYLSEVQNQEQLKLASEICRHHHERHDGSGYPDRLRGEEISIGARIVSLADVYDALLSERAYKKAFSREKAYQMIMDGECGVFHPRLMQAFEDAREDLEQCANEIIE